MPVPFLWCMVRVAPIYGLPPRVLPAIQAVEGGAPGVVRHNRDGSDDLGVMQVNTRWIGPIARHAGLPEAEVRERLVSDSCFNIAAAGAIMRTFMFETHGDLMRAVAYYHSHRAARGGAYRSRVVLAAARLFQPEAVPAAAMAARRMVVKLSYRRRPVAARHAAVRYGWRRW